MVLLIIILSFLGYIIYIALQWHITNIIAKNNKLSNDKVKCLCDIAKHIRIPENNTK